MCGLRPTISEPQHASGKNKLVSVVAVRRDPANGVLLGDRVDLTDLVHDGILYWDIPEGYWRVFVLSENKDGGSKAQEDYLNPLDRESVRILLDTVYGSFLRTVWGGFRKDDCRFFLG